MSRIIVPNQAALPQAGDVQMRAEQGRVVLTQCLIISQVFADPEEAERFAQGLIDAAQLARKQRLAALALIEANGHTEKSV